MHLARVGGCMEAGAPPDVGEKNVVLEREFITKDLIQVSINLNYLCVSIAALIIALGWILYIRVSGLN